MQPGKIENLRLFEKDVNLLILRCKGKEFLNIILINLKQYLKSLPNI